MSDVNEQISALRLADPDTSGFPTVIASNPEHPIDTPSTSNSPNEAVEDMDTESDTDPEDSGGSDSEVEPTPLATCEAHEAKILALQLRLAELEKRMTCLTENDARREAEIVRIKADSEARFQALEGRIAEILSRVLVMQEGLVRSGTSIQRRQRA